MSSPPAPIFIAVDHVSRTVPDLDAAVRFYTEVFGASERYRMGPLAARDLPTGADGRDWMESHVNVAGATLTLAMLKLADNLDLQLVQYDAPAERRQEAPRNCDLGGHHIAFRVDDVDNAAAYLAAHGCRLMEMIEISEGPLAGKKNLYVVDPWGLQLEIVD